MIGAVAIRAPAVVMLGESTTIMHHMAARDRPVDDHTRSHRARREPQASVIDIARAMQPIAMGAIAVMAREHRDPLVMPIARVAFVNTDFDAARIGGDGLIVVGDRIIGLGATRVDDAADLIMALEAHRPGDQAELHIRRGDQRKSLKITLGGTR